MKCYIRQIKPYIQPPALQGFSNKPYPIEGYEWFPEDMEEELREEITVEDHWSTLIFKERYISIEELHQKPIKIVYDNGWKARNISDFEIELSRKLSPSESEELIKGLFGTTDIAALDCSNMTEEEIEEIDRIVDEFNKIGCTSFQVTANELKEVLRRQEYESR